MSVRHARPCIFADGGWAAGADALRSLQEVEQVHPGIGKFIQRQEAARAERERRAHIPHSTGEAWTGRQTVPISPKFNIRAAEAAKSKKGYAAKAKAKAGGRGGGGGGGGGGRSSGYADRAREKNLYTQMFHDEYSPASGVAAGSPRPPPRPQQQQQQQQSQPRQRQRQPHDQHGAAAASAHASYGRRASDALGSDSGDAPGQPHLQQQQHQHQHHPHNVFSQFLVQSSAAPTELERPDDRSRQHHNQQQPQPQQQSQSQQRAPAARPGSAPHDGMHIGGVAGARARVRVCVRDEFVRIVGREVNSSGGLL